jgi:hypothetical protein
MSSLTDADREAFVALEQSLWTREAGRWFLRFHQGTRAPGA